MKKFIISLVLAAMMVFSLSAEVKTLKERTVSGVFNDTNVTLLSIDEDDDNITYVVRREDLDGSDIVNVYYCSSLVEAFNVWNMSRYEIQKNSHLIEEFTNTTKNGTLYLYKVYLVNINALNGTDDK